jgi:GTP-binding protein
MRFIDELEIFVASGNGGDGCASFRREKHVPRGGPDGGDGGKGGTVVLEATARRNTLQDFRHNKWYRAPNGTPGKGRQMTGARGEDLLLEVPLGTVVYDAASNEVLADLAEEGARWELPGGGGGLGNIHFKTSTNRSPLKATEGKPGIERKVRLELKLIADVGLLGFPNAGKSTFISRVTSAKARVAAYPFTTLVPNLGVVEVSPGHSFVISDIPGLIEGAAEGKGLGHDFLRHVERCAVYLHLVSPEDLEGDPVERFVALSSELERYDASLLERTMVPVLTKVDLLDEATRDDLLQALSDKAGSPAFAISSVTGQGLKDLIYAVSRLLSVGD